MTIKKIKINIKISHNKNNKKLANVFFIIKIIVYYKYVYVKLWKRNQIIYTAKVLV
jgi:hypothetical protein